VGEVDETERNNLYSKARALLHLITWREPFGLVMIEAMACGCPVIALDKGSVPEIVRHGVTGFVATEYAEARDAVGTLDEINRETCRDYARTTFSARAMTDGYETIYRKLVRRAALGFSSARIAYRS
jgi:glycosyltransferase involved in cell wall biosynthesis